MVLPNMHQPLKPALIRISKLALLRFHRPTTRKYHRIAGKHTLKDEQNRGKLTAVNL